jgi:hypothetical protein
MRRGWHGMLARSRRRFPSEKEVVSIQFSVVNAETKKRRRDFVRFWVAGSSANFRTLVFLSRESSDREVWAGFRVCFTTLRSKEID